MFSDIKSQYQLQKGNNNKLTKVHTQNRGVINKTFILEKRRMTTAQKYGSKGFNDSKSSLPSTSSMIYQNHFYKSNASNYRGNQFPSKDTNNYSYQSNNSHSAKRRKRDRNEEIWMKVTKINVSSQPRISSLTSSKLNENKKELHNIKIKGQKASDFHSILTISNPKLFDRNNHFK